MSGGLLRELGDQPIQRAGAANTRERWLAFDRHLSQLRFSCKILGGAGHRRWCAWRGTVKRQSIIIVGIGVAILAVGVFLFTRGPGELAAVRTLVEAALLIGFVTQLLYGWFHRHSFAFYLFIERTRVRFSRRAAVWDLAVRYAVPWSDSGTELMDGADSAIRSVAGDQVRMRSLGNWQRLYEWEHTGIRVEVTAEPPQGAVPSANEPLVNFYIRVGNLRVPFADSESTLEKRILPLLEAVEDSVRPEERAYTLTAAFESGQNPYLGLLLHWFPPEYIESFEAGLHLLPADDGSNGGSVQIERDQVSVTSPARRPFRRAALQCLTLSLARSPAAP